jgi:long-subunit acyl-CoA synthetase (AMP-forming)
VAGSEEVTPTMKLRRKPIAEKYAATIDALYC